MIGRTLERSRRGGPRTVTAGRCNGNGNSVKIMRSLAIGVAAAATLASAGCGAPDKETEQPPGAGAASDAGSGAEETAAGTLRFADEGFACTLLTRADVEALFDGPVAAEPQPKDVGRLRTCTWTEADSASLVDLSIDEPSGGASRKYDEMWKLYGVSQPAGTRPAKEISGLGDKAYPSSTAGRPT
ncbi:hypothetical protein AB0J80_04865 [Actinoplanes sp. NPDC049548]|uniref:hypothetical protein n=1 Tax=Actinoplanes sp. NPDC049548 TaxID=3155152 RepID=UPI003449B527